MSKSSSSTDRIEQVFTVPVSISKAFNMFTEGLSSWWPKEYTWSKETLRKIEIEPGINGRCYERGPHGFECDWGRVLTWDPPNRIVLTWQIDSNRVPEPNPEKVSEIEVLFEQKAENNTQVTFEHRKFDNHGENSNAYKKALRSPQGWPYILGKFKEAVS